MLGIDLKTLRHHHRWTRRELAGRLGVTEYAVYRWETGSRHISASIERLIAYVFADAAHTPRLRASVRTPKGGPDK